MQETLALLIKAVAYSEIEIERSRHTIQALISEHPQNVFALVDSNHNGLITANEISKFLKHYKVEATNDEIKAIINYYNVSKERGLNFEDFTAALTPRQHNQAVRKVEDKDLGVALARFFSRELALWRKTEPLRQKLEDAKNWSSFDSFKCIDAKSNGSFTNADLDAFLQKNNVVISSADVTAAFNRLDRENKQKVTFPDFEENLFYDHSSKDHVSLPKHSHRHSHKHSPHKNSPGKTAGTPTFSPSKSNYLPEPAIKAYSPQGSPARPSLTLSHKAGTLPVQTELNRQHTFSASAPTDYVPSLGNNTYTSTFGSTTHLAKSHYVPSYSTLSPQLDHTKIAERASLRSPARSPGTVGYAGYSTSYAGYSSSVGKFGYEGTSPARTFNTPPLKLPASPLFEIGAGSSYKPRYY